MLRIARRLTGLNDDSHREQSVIVVQTAGGIINGERQPTVRPGNNRCALSNMENVMADATDERASRGIWQILHTLPGWPCISANILGAFALRIQCRPFPICPV